MADKNIEGLRNLLKMRKNQYEMLRNTLFKLTDGDVDSVIASKERIMLIQNEIDSTINEMRMIQKDIEKASENNVEYSFYDNVDKTSYENAEGVNDNFYDSIVKQPKIAKVVHHCGVNCVCRSEDSNPSDGYTASTASTYIDEINDNEKNMLRSNGFIANVLESLEIPSTMVKSVLFDESSKKVMLTVYDFVRDINGKKYPLMELIRLSKIGEFSFSVDRLDNGGEVKYTEVYSKCKIDEVNRSCLDYSVSDFSTVDILISYEKVRYEVD